MQHLASEGGCLAEACTGDIGIGPMCVYINSRENVFKPGMVVPTCDPSPQGARTPFLLQDKAPQSTFGVPFIAKDSEHRKNHMLLRN